MSHPAAVEAWRPLVDAYASQYGADVELVLSIIEVESGGEPSAMSPLNSNGSRDYGLMQLSSKGALQTWLDNGFRAIDPLDATDNIKVGCWFVGRSIPTDLRNKGCAVTRENIIVAYNAGSNAVVTGKIPSSTLSYLAKVQSRYADTFAADDTGVGFLQGGNLEAETTGAATSSSWARFGIVGVGALALWSLYKSARDA